MSGKRYYEVYSITDEGNFFRVLTSRDGKVEQKLVAECEKNKLILQMPFGKLNMYLNRTRDIEVVNETWKRGSPPGVGNASTETHASPQMPKLDDGVVKAIVGIGLDRPKKAMPSQFHVRNTISGKSYTFQFEGVSDPSVPWVIKARIVETNAPGYAHSIFGWLPALTLNRKTDGGWDASVMKNLSFVGDWKNKKVGSKIEVRYQMANANGITTPQFFKCDVTGEVDASAISNKFSGRARYLDCAQHLNNSPALSRYVFFDDYQYAFGLVRPFFGAEASFVFVDGP